VVLPNLLRLLAAFRGLGCLVLYTRIASLNENLRDVPGLARQVLAGGLRDLHGSPYHLLAGERAAQADERLRPGPQDVVLPRAAAPSARPTRTTSCAPTAWIGWCSPAG